MSISKIIIGLVVVVVIVLGINAFSKKDSGSEATSVMEDAGSMANESMMSGEAGSGSAGGDAMAETAGSYEEYSPEKVASAGENKTILFFHAPWCPTCKSADKDISQNLNLIPDDVVILKTDYDNSSELKKKYGVTYQHTFVQVDAEGNQIKKWSGGGLSSILDNII